MSGARSEELLSQLVALDRELLALVSQRATLSEALREERAGKAKPGAPRLAAPLDGEYVARVLAELGPTALEPSVALLVLRAVEAASLPSARAGRVVVPCARGDVAWLAARERFGPASSLSSQPSVQAALDEVARGRADFALVPYESARDGLSFSALLAIAQRELRLLAEHELEHRIDLVGASGASMAAVRRVLGPAHLLSACTAFLRASFADVPHVDEPSPEHAAQRVASESDTAALVPRGLPLPSGVTVWRESVADDRDARVRYVVVGARPAPRSGSDATALLFSVHDRPGALHEVLRPLAERGCNLRRIHSRTTGGEAWQYVFYAEVDGHATDRALVAALEGVKKAAKTLQVLGSFPVESRPAAPDAP
jgi:chorismate mutase/prephenate dehydratase